MFVSKNIYIYVCLWYNDEWLIAAKNFVHFWLFKGVKNNRHGALQQQILENPVDLRNGWK